MGEEGKSNGDDGASVVGVEVGVSGLGEGEAEVIIDQDLGWTMSLVEGDIVVRCWVIFLRAAVVNEQGLLLG